jgi:hypothetical protein
MPYELTELDEFGLVVVVLGLGFGVVWYFTFT